MFAGPLLRLSGRTLYVGGFLEHPDKCVFLSVRTHSLGWEGSQHTKVSMSLPASCFSTNKSLKRKKKKSVHSVPPPVTIFI